MTSWTQCVINETLVAGWLGDSVAGWLCGQVGGRVAGWQRGWVAGLGGVGWVGAVA